MFIIEPGHEERVMRKVATALRCLMVLVGAVFIADAGAQTKSSPPDFSSATWMGNPGEDFFVPVPGAPAPIATDPGYPYVTNTVSLKTGQQPNYHIPDLTNPNLKQWAKDVMRKDTDEVLAG